MTKNEFDSKYVGDKIAVLFHSFEDVRIYFGYLKRFGYANDWNENDIRYCDSVHKGKFGFVISESSSYVTGWFRGRGLERDGLNVIYFNKNINSKTKKYR